MGQQQDSFELPVPDGGQVSLPSDSSTKSSGVNTHQSTPADNNPSINAPATAKPTSDDNIATKSSNSPAVADDADLIEKEWVVKAKQIVAATKNDPYNQNKEINKFRADYLKKRYKKDIKIEEI